MLPFVERPAAEGRITDVETGEGSQALPGALPARWRGRRWLERRVTFSAGALLFLASLAILAPVLVQGDPSRIDLTRGPLPPSAAHPFGTDMLGRDELGMAIYGARVSLAVGVFAAGVSGLLGLTLGLVAAYRGGLVDVLVCRIVDATIAVPAFFVLIAAQSLLGPGVANVIVMVSLVNWMATARVVRALVMSLKQREFVIAACALGCSSRRIILRHLLPNVTHQVAVLYALGVADALLMESALSFLGLGVPPTEPSWGNMLSSAQAGILSGAWWLALFPGGLILVTVMSINVLGDTLSEARLTSS